MSPMGSLSRRSLPIAVLAACLAWPNPAVAAPARRSGPAAPRDTVLAKVGDRTITLASFRQEWNHLQSSQTPPNMTALKARQAFLQDLVTRELLSQQARRGPYALTPQQEADVDSVRRILMKNQLFSEVVEKPIRLDPADVNLYRDQLTRIVQLQAYVFPKREAAQAWYTRIVGGTPVSRLEAAARSGSPDAPQILDLGFRYREQLWSEQARAAFALAPERLSPPVPYDHSWAILRLLSSRPRPAPVALADTAAVLDEMRRILAVEAREAYRDTLARDVHIRYNQAALDSLLPRFLQLPGRMDPTQENTINLYIPLPAFTRSDSMRVVATTTMGSVTGTALLRFLADTPPYGRPDVRNSKALLSLVDRVAFDAELLRKSQRMGLDRHPYVVYEVRKRREGFLVEAMYRDSVASRIRVPEDSLRALFAADSSRFAIQDSARVWLVVTERQALSDSILKAARGGADPAELAARFSLIEGSAPGGMSPMFARGNSPFPNLEPSIFSTAVGAYAGPVQIPEGWAVFRVIQKTQGRMRTYEEALPLLVTTYRSREEERQMQAFIARVRGRFPVEEHPERLEAMGGL